MLSVFIDTLLQRTGDRNDVHVQTPEGLIADVAGAAVVRSAVHAALRYDFRPDMPLPWQCEFACS